MPLWIILAALRILRPGSNTWFAWYDAYLSTPHWRDVSSVVTTRPCARARRGDCAGPLQAHHLRRGYRRLGHERPRDLVCLCAKHHDERHAQIRRMRRAA